MTRNNKLVCLAMSVASRPGLTFACEVGLLDRFCTCVYFRKIDRKIKRWRDRKIESWRDRATEMQTERQTEKQRDRKTQRLIDGDRDTSTQRNGETEQD